MGNDSAEPTGPPGGAEFLRDAEILDATVRLRSGERGKEADSLARAVIRDFMLRQWLGHPQSPATLEWLAEVLSNILDGAKPLDELGLMPPPATRPSAPRRWRDVAIWLAAAERLGHSSAQAVQLAAAKFHKDPKTVEAYRRRAAKAGIELLASEAEIALYFSEVGPPPPRRDK